jgi:N-acetylglucosaminyl-diphospho-decaprenol L-rhamnosyltransferase
VGWKVVYFPDTPVVHIGGERAKHEGEISSSSQEIESLQIESELLYFRKNHSLIGVLMHLLLNSLADFIQLLKDLIKVRPAKRVLFNLKHALFVWKMFFRTSLTSKPTR